VRAVALDEQAQDVVVAVSGVPHVQGPDLDVDNRARGCSGPPAAVHAVGRDGQQRLCPVGGLAESAEGAAPAAHLAEE
jgi:hypothetical protein